MFLLIKNKWIPYWLTMCFRWVRMVEATRTKIGGWRQRHPSETPSCECPVMHALCAWNPETWNWLNFSSLFCWSWFAKSVCWNLHCLELLIVYSITTCLLFLWNKMIILDSVVNIKIFYPKKLKQDTPHQINNIERVKTIYLINDKGYFIQWVPTFFFLISQ